MEHNEQNCHDQNCIEHTRHLGRRTYDGVEPMTNYGIFEDTMVVVKRNNQRKCLKINHVVPGDFILGFDLNNNQDVYNRVLEIQELEVAEENQVRIWFKQGTYPDQFIIAAKGQQFDIHNYDLMNWDYRKAEELMSGTLIKGTLQDVSLNTIDSNCDMTGKFYMFILSGSRNFYVRKHEDEYDPKNPSTEEKDWSQGYKKDYEDFILVRGLKG